MKKTLLTCIIIIILMFISACAHFNAIELETGANDPLMTNLLDTDMDLAQIEDGTGFVGEATSCPT
ncbi:hypothetical protein KAR48_02345 [bacterium]|nr:hypothetical protein [bacterium]